MRGAACSLAAVALVGLACAGAGPSGPTAAPASTEETPMSQDKPPPPPPPGAADEGPMDPDSPKGRYASWLADQGKPADGIQQGHPAGAGDWQFFFVAGPTGIKGSPAAVGPEQIVTAGEPDGWSALLSSAPAGDLHAQIAWLHGAWGAVAPGAPIAGSIQQKHPALADHLEAPRVEAVDGGHRFTGWFFEPPAMTPFRFTITATGEGTAFDRTMLHDLAGG